MKIERIFSKREGVYSIPCMANFLGNIEIAGDYISYIEQMAVLATVRGESRDEATERFLFGEEPEMLTVFARNPLNRRAIEGQNPLKIDIFETNKEDIPLQDENKMTFLEGSLEVI